jgi:rRNA maturation endonuclease Nob1
VTFASTANVEEEQVPRPQSPSPSSSFLILPRTTKDWAEEPDDGLPEELEFHLESYSISEDEEEEADGEGTWITPANIRKQKIRDATSNTITLANFLAPSEGLGGQRRRSEGWERRSESGGGAAKGLLKSALMTGDFAMQNVALQMGMNLVNMEGLGVKSVKTWVLRCHGCFRYRTRTPSPPPFSPSSSSWTDGKHDQEYDGQVLSELRR